jgi:septal ring factor EnvC (AmiA/AmiB activator)
MRWWRFGIKKSRESEEDIENGEKAIRKADESLRDLESKIAEDKEKSPELARAVASARRVEYRVHKFTQEISDSFGRLNHG